MMRLKHNKKRNTAFLYEALVRELTKSIVAGDPSYKNKIVAIMKEHFSKGKILFKELELYKNLLETRGVAPHTADKLMFESKRVHGSLDKTEIFNEQSAVISKINKTLSKGIFSNFVPNYKNLGTLFQIFNNEEVTVKQKVLLEQEILQEMIVPAKQQGDKNKMVPIDNIVYKNFVKTFNSSYKGLHEEQRNLLNKYVSSFSGGQLEFKLFLNEEIGRIKEAIVSSKESTDDTNIRESVEKVLNLFENVKIEKIDKKMLLKVLKVQNLVRELQN